MGCHQGLHTWEERRHHTVRRLGRWAMAEDRRCRMERRQEMGHRRHLRRVEGRRRRRHHHHHLERRRDRARWVDIGHGT